MLPILNCLFAFGNTAATSEKLLEGRQYPGAAIEYLGGVAAYSLAGKEYAAVAIENSSAASEYSRLAKKNSITATDFSLVARL